jgi:hypothetical protein
MPNLIFEIFDCKQAITLIENWADQGSMSVTAILRQLIAGAIPPLDFKHRTSSSRDRLLVSFDTPHHIQDDIRVSIGSCHCGA